MRLNLWALTGLSVFLSACGTQGMNMAPYRKADYTPEKFAVCHGYGCNLRTESWITTKQWQKIEASFKPAAKTAEKERAQIAKAIGLMETYAGLSSGVNQDRAEAVTYPGDRDTQMDCIDETVNTDLYLRFLADAGLMAHHTHAYPVHRGYFLDGAWPHNSAAIKDKETGTVYVVDTYYRAHGEEPYILPLSEWAAFWQPEKRTPREERFKSVR